MAHRVRNAQKAYEARKEKRALRNRELADQDTAAAGPKPEPISPTAWGSEQHGVAARQLIGNKLTCSFRHFCREWNVDRKWAQKLAIVAASSFRTEQQQCFRELIENTKAAKGLRLVAAVVQRAYDETGKISRTQSLTKAGAETSTETAKLMSGDLNFALVFANGDDYRCVMEGSLATPTGSMRNQIGSVVAECLSRFFDIDAVSSELLAQLCPLVIAIRCTDSHASYPRTERILSAE
jgi:hypothetical protein